jgi:hypothetical protein
MASTNAIFVEPLVVTEPTYPASLESFTYNHCCHPLIILSPTIIAEYDLEQYYQNDVVHFKGCKDFLKPDCSPNSDLWPSWFSTTTPNPTQFIHEKRDHLRPRCQ